MLRRCGVVGHPAGHSLSPAIHRAGYEANSLQWAYDCYNVSPEELTGFVQARIDDPVWAGLSVTAPHKQAILAFGEADEPTRLLGAGNTVVFAGEVSRVFNTDVPGFVRAWHAYGLVAPATATILGNGATARSILLALAGLGVREVRILARRPERAAGVLDLAATLGVHAEAHGLSEAPVATDLLVNTIPAAATGPHALALAAAARVVFDAVYDPWPTPLSEAADRAGCVALSGLDLLAGQAVDQFFLLTGARVSFEACRSAAEQELRRRAGL